MQYEVGALAWARLTQPRTLPAFTLFFLFHVSRDIVAFGGKLLAILCSSSARGKQQEACLLALVLAIS